jgi:hypothetical protein
LVGGLVSILIVLVVACGVAVIVAAAQPPTAGRVAAFARRHGLDLTPGDEPYVAAYLRHMRRWRAVGAVGGLLVGIVHGLPDDRIVFQFFPMLAGWFAGAVVAEFRFPAVEPSGAAEPAVPRWLLRVPAALAAVTVVVTGAAFALDQAGRVLAWCAGAVVIIVAIRATASHVLRRPTAVRAVAEHAVGTITGGGGALVAWFLVQEVAVVDGRFFDAAGTAAHGIEFLWVLGGLVIAMLLAAAARGVARRRSPVPALLVVAALVVVSAGWAGYAWWQDRAPFSPAAARATATVRFTSFESFPQDARQLGITGLNRMVDQPGYRQFVGRVDYARRAGTGSAFHVFVIDKRQNRVARQLFGVDGGGWDSTMSSLADRYAWLSATAPAVTGGGYTFNGSEVSGDAGAPGPITFVGSLAGADGASPSDLMVVLVLTGPDNQIYWATPVDLAA